MASMATNVYCHNVPLHWDKDEIEEAFSKFGSIVSTRILKNPQQISRGVCFIRYSQHDEAAAAISALNSTMASGGTAPLLCKFAKETGAPGSAGPAPSYGAAPSGYGGAPSAARYSPYSRPAAGGQDTDRTNLYVQGLPVTHNEEAIKALFQPYGNVVSTFILTDRDTHQSRGIGFCRMNSEAEAVASMDGLNGTQVEGADMPLSLSFAKDTKKRIQPQTPMYPATYYPPTQAAYQPYPGYGAYPPASTPPFPPTAYPPQPEGGPSYYPPQYPSFGAAAPPGTGPGGF